MSVQDKINEAIDTLDRLEREKREVIKELKSELLGRVITIDCKDYNGQICGYSRPSMYGKKFYFDNITCLHYDLYDNDSTGDLYISPRLKNATKSIDINKCIIGPKQKGLCPKCNGKRWIHDFGYPEVCSFCKGDRIVFMEGIG